MPMMYRLIFLALLTALSAQAQISEAGLPPSFAPENESLFAAKTMPVAVLPALNVAKARQEDAAEPGQNRFAAPILTDISPEKNGAWTDLPNGDRVWRCAVRSSGALGLVLLFDRFQIPAGGQFFAFTPDQKKVLGAYTAKSCIPSGKFTIGIVPGETAVLEYHEPQTAKNGAQIHLNRVDYAYDLAAMQDGQTAGALDFGQSLPCNVNVNCPEGVNWQTEKKGVARILMVFSNGSGWCSGTMIANTSGSGEPLFLTAQHCQLIGQSPDFDQWAFHFDYEAAGCTNPGVEPTLKSILGCQRLAYRIETDFLLLKLNPIPASYGVYFNGWTRAATPPANTAFIHHPNGDIKKISIDNQAPVVFNKTLNWGGVFGSSQPNTHWEVKPDVGVFQPGSSGCPLFDPSKRLFGQLHGGSWDVANACLNNLAYFGRFDLSWSQGATTDARLRDWLDPANTNAMTQNGYLQPAPTTVSISGNVQTHWGAAMAGVNLTLSGAASATTKTTAAGNFSFEGLQPNETYTLTPAYDTSDLNGVTTFDLVLISRHLLGLDTLDSPWKILAGDINASNSVTTFDIVEARKVILGINDAFPAVSSWRFFPAETMFPNPLNPFSGFAGGPPPAFLQYSNLQQNVTDANFRGVKVGDLNNSATPGQ